jgi:hypothetical protein
MTEFISIREKAYFLEIEEKAPGAIPSRTPGAYIPPFR